MAFLAPAFLWLLAAVPLVILLHFLRQRRRTAEVSALFLWQQATQPTVERRRFSLWWLLLLQILAVMLTAFVLARPVLVGAGVPDRVAVIDASASMAAQDSEGVRMVRAVAIAAGLASEGGRVALVRAGSDASVLHGLTADTAAVSAALASLEAADAGSDIERAIQLASDLAPGAEVHVITDQAPPSGSAHTWHNVAGDGRNLGIVTFDLGLQQAFVAVASTYPGPQQVPVRLFRDGEPAGSADLLVPAGGRAGTTFPLTAQGGVFEVRLTPPEDDALQLDDVAFQGTRDLRVWFPGDSTPLLRALEAVPGVQLVPAAAGADVRVTEETEPGAAGGNRLLYPPRSAAPDYQEVRDWDAGDPLLRFVDLRGSVVGVSVNLPLDEDGWRVLARSGDLRPVIRSREDAGDLTVQLAFNPSQTDLVYRPAFPTLIANIMASYRGTDSLVLGQSLPAGSLFGGQAVSRVTGPGLFELPTGPATASLLSLQETILPGPPPADAVDAAAGSAADALATDRPLDWLLLLLVPMLLAAEWIVWARHAAR